MKSKTTLILAYGAAAIASLFLLFVIFRVSTPDHGARPSTASSVSEPQQSVAQAVRERLAGKSQTADLAQLYRGRNYAPLWMGANGLSDDGRQVLSLLAAADKEALPASRYGVAPPPAANALDTIKADFDIALTQAALHYASDLRWGAFRPAQFFDDVSMTRDKDDVVAGLSQAAGGGNGAAYLKGLAPSVQEYGQLRDALARYRALAASGGWPQVAGEGKSVNMAQLKARLQVEGYLPPDPQGASPAAIGAALRAYQADSGMTADGKLDRRTLAMLNVPAEARAQQIAVNMERLRWMPHDLGSQYILVNVPDASLALMESGRPALVSRVVVGAPDKPTPILATKAVAVTINPAWHVPKSIVAKEIQPKLDQNAGYLEAKHMEMHDGEVIQLPGPDNALGSAKFEMPNPFDVYLHDTPSKHAFLSDERALSHGCVRVEQIHPLVEHVLGLSDEELQQAIADGKTQSRHLDHPIPVYIQYWTAITRDDHRTVFREDVYGRDAKMIQALFPGDASVQLASSR